MSKVSDATNDAVSELEQQLDIVDEELGELRVRFADLKTELGIEDDGVDDEDDEGEDECDCKDKSVEDDTDEDDDVWAKCNCRKA